jgi:hypothetical protein
MKAKRWWYVWGAYMRSGKSKWDKPFRYEQPQSTRELARQLARSLRVFYLKTWVLPEGRHPRGYKSK